MIKTSVNITEETEIKNDSPERFVVFVAARIRPIISFANFERAEEMAIIFARLTNVRMEVFDSEKEICYFVEPSETRAPFVH